ncbi:MAG: periplasmic heavy metal sensor [Pseudodesulfovibrio sp.]
MTKRNITTMALALALVMAVASFAVAGPGGRGQMGFERGGCGACNDGPGLRGLYNQLTPEKKAAVDTIFESYRVKFNEVRDAMRTKHAVLEAMVNGGQADEKKIAKVVSDMSSLRDKMFDLRKAMSADLSKELGIDLAQGGFGCGGPGFGGPGNGPDDCPGYGQGNGQGYGHGMRGDGPRWQ